MPEPHTTLLLAILIQAPFAFRLGFVVRDGREISAGLLFLALGSGTAALTCFLSGSLLLAVPAALALTVLLAHARFLGAHRAPAAAEEMGAPVAAAEAGPLPENPPPDALHAGMAFLGDLLETTDRVGELRHKRRLRQLERQQAERQAATTVSVSRPAPRRLAPQVRRDGPVWEHPRLPPPE